MVERDVEEDFFSSPIIVLSDAENPDDPRVVEIRERLQGIHSARVEEIPAYGSPLGIYHRGAIIRRDNIEYFLAKAERVARMSSGL